MKIGKEGRQLIADVEGRRHSMYLDTAGKPSIGIGHLIKPSESWMLTATLTDAQIDELFTQDIAWAESATSRVFPNVTRQNQFDALVSFVFNLGEPQVVGGTLDNLINEGATPEAISAKWMQYIRSGGSIAPGLITRRAKELALYWSHLWRTVVACLLIAAAFFCTSSFLLIT